MNKEQQESLKRILAEVDETKKKAGQEIAGLLKKQTKEAITKSINFHQFCPTGWYVKSGVNNVLLDEPKSKSVLETDFIILKNNGKLYSFLREIKCSYKGVYDYTFHDYNYKIGEELKLTEYFEHGLAFLERLQTITSNKEKGLYDN